MKRSETNVGDLVVVGNYGRRAEIADNGAWSRGGSYGFRVSDADYAAHLEATGGNRKGIGPKYACVSDNVRTGQHVASFKRSTGATILVRYSAASGSSRLDVTTLSAVRPLAEYEQETQRHMAEVDRVNAARDAKRARVALLPPELRASTTMYAAVLIADLDALERIVAAAQTLDDLVGGGFVDEETVARVQEDAAQRQMEESR